MPIIKETHYGTGETASVHKIESLKFDRDTGKVLCWVRSTKEGFTKPIEKDWKHLTMEEFEAAEPTTEHDGEINKMLSKAYVALDAKYFNPPTPEPEEEDEETIPAE